MEPNLSKQEIVRAATNDPSLSQKIVLLGDREFPIVDLPYKDHILFLAKLQPLLEGLAAGVASTLKVPLPGAGLTAAGLLKYCMESLPEMACIVCRQTDPTITPEYVMEKAKSPIQLATIVLKQIEHNNTLTELSDFFVQVIPMINSAMAALPSTIKGTH